MINCDLRMTIHHKYYLCKHLSSSPYLTLDVKKEIMKLIYENDNSDSTIHFKYICEIRIPDPEMK